MRRATSCPDARNGGSRPPASASTKSGREILENALGQQLISALEAGGLGHMILDEV